MAKSAVIFLRSSFFKPAQFEERTKNALLIGCDGGTQHILDLGLVPDVAIGDFDSFDPVKLPTQTKVIRFPADKDKLDSELAIRYAIEQGCTKITILGFYGDRFDHMLGNTFLLSHPDFQDIDLRIISGQQEIYAVRQSVQIHGQIDDVISFFPLSEIARATSTHGALNYPLNDYELSPHGNQGISNVLVKKTVEVEVQQGSLLIIHTHQAIL